VINEFKADIDLQKIPIVAVTASSMSGDSNRALAAGFDGYIPKPIEPETFVQQVEKFLPPDLRASRTDGV
jgi:CheY-like chemotaxis protein